MIEVGAMFCLFSNRRNRRNPSCSRIAAVRHASTAATGRSAVKHFLIRLFGSICGWFYLGALPRTPHFPTSIGREGV